MERHVLPLEQVHSAARSTVANTHRDFVDQVRAAVDEHDIVVVGMKQNPVPGKVRALLSTRDIPYHYIEHGSYFSGWRRRNALKMWTGWPTFPMVFVKGRLIGGFAETKALDESGELAPLVSAPR